MDLVIGENYANFDENHFDPMIERVAFITGVDEKFVTGFRWSYENSAVKNPFRIGRARFEKEYHRIAA